MTFADKLKSLRTNKGLSQSELAKGCGIPLYTIRAYEQQARSPSAETLFLLAKTLGTDCREFQKCTFTMKKQPPKPQPRRGK